MEKSICQERNPKTASGGGEADAVPGQWRGGAPRRGQVQMASQCCNCRERWPGLNARAEPGWDRRTRGRLRMAARSPEEAENSPLPSKPQRACRWSP